MSEQCRLCHQDVSRRLAAFFNSQVYCIGCLDHVIRRALGAIPDDHCFVCDKVLSAKSMVIYQRRPYCIVCLPDSGRIC